MIISIRLPDGATAFLKMPFSLRFAIGLSRLELPSIEDVRHQLDIVAKSQHAKLEEVKIAVTALSTTKRKTEDQIPSLKDKGRDVMSVEELILQEVGCGENGFYVFTFADESSQPLTLSVLKSELTLICFSNKENVVVYPEPGDVWLPGYRHMDVMAIRGWICSTCEKYLPTRRSGANFNFDLRFVPLAQLQARQSSLDSHSPRAPIPEPSPVVSPTDGSPVEGEASFSAAPVVRAATSSPSLKGILSKFFKEMASTAQAPATSRPLEPLSPVSDSGVVMREIAPTELALEAKPLNQGGAGLIYRGTWKLSETEGKPVAVKQFLVEADTPGAATSLDMRDFEREASLMTQLLHCNLVQCYGICRMGKFSIVMELMAGGSVYGLLHNPTRELPGELRYKILSGAAAGLEYLHENQVIHRDIKSPNLLLTEDGTPKWCDFGISRVYVNRAMTKGIGTPCWSAPEVLKGETYTIQADVYSFGILMWEVMSRQEPYEELGDIPAWELPNKVIAGQRPLLDRSWNPQVVSLMQSCWKQKCSTRPTMEGVARSMRAIGAAPFRVLLESSSAASSSTTPEMARTPS